jgi:hypothetical protein
MLPGMVRFQTPHGENKALDKDNFNVAAKMSSELLAVDHPARIRRHRT